MGVEAELPQHWHRQHFPSPFPFPYPEQLRFLLEVAAQFRSLAAGAEAQFRCLLAEEVVVQVRCLLGEAVGKVRHRSVRVEQQD
jgi:hypothetical protein